MKTFILSFSVLLCLSTFSCTHDGDNSQPTFKEQIAPRTDYFLTTSQLSTYADMDVVNQHAELIEYTWDNLAADTAMINSAGTEAAVLYRSNEWLAEKELDEVEELPELLYIGDYAQTPGITQAEIDILDDIDAIIVAHYNDVNGWYDDFKSYIESVNIGNLSIGIQQEMATTLYMLDVSFHYTEVLALGWGGGSGWWHFHPTAAQTRCMLSVISGAAIGFGVSGFNPFVGIASGVAAFANTDACWE